MNRRDVLKSSAFLAGGLAVTGIPQKAFAIRPIIPPLPKFNENILNAYCTTHRAAVIGLNQNSVTAAELTALATAFATFVDEMNSTGYSSSVQSSLTSNAAEISALDAATVDVATLLAQAQAIAPVTYAQMQSAAQQINSSSISAALSPTALATAYSTYETGIQQLATLAQQSGGVLDVSTSLRRERPHLQEVNLRMSVGLSLSAGVFMALSIVVAVAFPEGLLIAGVIDVAETLALSSAMMNIDAGIEGMMGD